MTRELFEFFEHDICEDLDSAPSEQHEFITSELSLFRFVRESLRSANSPFFDPDNFEDVAAAIEELSFRFHSALFPFVKEWDPQLVRFGEDRNSNIDDVFHKADLETKENLRLFAKQLQRQPEGFIFQRLTFRIRRGLRRWLCLSPGQDLSYLSKLCNFADTVDIFTLNYDLAVETALQDSGIEYVTGFVQETEIDPFTRKERGIGRWNSGSLNSSHARVRLHKLHGSLSWIHSSLPPLQREIIELPPNRWNESFEGDLCAMEDWNIWNRFDPPTMVFGLENKLLGFEPYLSLFARFAHRIREAECLVTIGCNWQAEKTIRGLLGREITKTHDDLKLIEVTKSDGVQTTTRLTQGAANAIRSGALGEAIDAIRESIAATAEMRRVLGGSGFRHWEG